MDGTLRSPTPGKFTCAAHKNKTQLDTFFLSVMRIRIKDTESGAIWQLDPGSGIRCLLDPWIPRVKVL